MLAAVFATDSIVAKYMVSVDIDIKVVALFPHFLYQPRTNILLAHVINQVFELREIRRLVDKDIAVWVSWATQEALGILGIDGGGVSLFCYCYCCSQLHGAIGLCGVHLCWPGLCHSHGSCPWALMERRMD
jgi:hypothetical protein